MYWIGWKTGYLGLAYFLGNFWGSFIFGWLADNWGRRPCLLLGNIGSIIFATLFGFRSVSEITDYWIILNYKNYLICTMTHLEKYDSYVNFFSFISKTFYFAVSTRFGWGLVNSSFDVVIKTYLSEVHVYLSNLINTSYKFWLSHVVVLIRYWMTASKLPVFQCLQLLLELQGFWYANCD